MIYAFFKRRYYLMSILLFLLFKNKSISNGRVEPH